MYALRVTITWMLQMRLAYSVAETAQLLSVSRAWLYQLWAKGDGPPRVKIGSRTLIPADALSAWLEHRSSEARTVDKPEVSQ
jgi:excisionase family DNA binding protein